MKTAIITLVAIFGLLASSCTSTYHGGYAAKPNLTINYNVDSELQIDTTKVLQATSTTKVYFGIIKVSDKDFSDAFGGNIGDREKSAATYKALQGTGYDIIVNPKYQITIRKGLFFKEVSATVAGYGAKVVVK